MDWFSVWGSLGLRLWGLGFNPLLNRSARILLLQDVGSRLTSKPETVESKPQHSGVLRPQTLNPKP